MGVRCVGLRAQPVRNSSATSRGNHELSRSRRATPRVAMFAQDYRGLTGTYLVRVAMFAQDYRPSDRHLSSARRQVRSGLQASDRHLSSARRRVRSGLQASDRHLSSLAVQRMTV